MSDGFERHICQWKEEGTSNTSVGELVINGNDIEFYLRDIGNMFSSAYIGSDTEHHYKIVTNGEGRLGKNKTLTLAQSLDVQYVLMQNQVFETGISINNINQFSFIVPELMDWFHRIRAVEILPPSENGEFRAGEIKYPDIVIHEKHPYIAITFESASFLETMQVDDRIEVIIKNQPRLCVTYETPVTITQVHSDIRSLMQFWGLLIGTVSNVLDIRLEFNDEVVSWLCINEDFSYNTKTQHSMRRPRTTLETVNDRITDLFANWYTFYNDDKFDLIRHMYFSANNRKDIFLEDIFVLYVRILEGYHLRITGDEAQSAALEVAIKDSK